jgi:hypothetical protein
LARKLHSLLQTDQTGGNKNMAKKQLKKAKKLEATKSLMMVR